MLLGAGAAVDAQDHRSQTALHLAAMNGHADSVQLLISRRMIRAGGWNYCSAAICLVPNVQIIPNSAEQTKDEQGLSADTKQAAENLDDVITDLVKKFAEVTAPLFLLCFASFSAFWCKLIMRCYFRERISSNCWSRRFSGPSTVTKTRI